MSWQDLVEVLALLALLIAWGVAGATAILALDVVGGFTGATLGGVAFAIATLWGAEAWRRG